MQVVAPMDVSELQKQLHYWRERAIKAENEREELAHELYTRDLLRRAPVLKPIDKAIIEEYHEVEKNGRFHDGDGRTRVNFTTIAERLHTSPSTVVRSAERIARLGLASMVDVPELAPDSLGLRQGKMIDRSYIKLIPEKLAQVHRLEDTEGIIPKQGGDQYICRFCKSRHVKIIDPGPRYQQSRT